MIKFGIKLAIAGGACYYLAEEGVWKDSDESIKLYGKISEAVAPLVKEVPIQIPDLPNTQCMSYLVKQTWNSGVMKTFEFLNDLPAHASEWSSKGYMAISDNPEIKKFLDSFNAPPSPPPPAPVEETLTK